MLGVAHPLAEWQSSSLLIGHSLIIIYHKYTATDCGTTMEPGEI